MSGRRWLTPTSVTLLITSLYVLWVLWLGGGDPLTFVQLGTRFDAGDPAGTEGYDGQFIYYIAADPLTAPDKIDVPAYRLQRIFYPAVVRLLSLGQVALIPWVMLVVNVVGLGVGVWLMERLLESVAANRWYALPFGLYAGQLLSIRVDLPEPLAMTLALLGFWLFAQDKVRWAAVAFALAVLTKETMLLTAAAFGLYLWLQRRWLAGVVFGAMVLAPFVAWQGVLYLWLGAVGIGSGGAGATGFSLLPLGGLLEIYPLSPLIFFVFLVLLGPSVLWPAGWALWRTAQDALAQRWHPWMLALALNALIVPFIPHSTFREPLAMFRFTIPLVACVILYAALRHRKTALRNSFLWLVLLAFLLQDPLLYQ